MRVQVRGFLLNTWETLDEFLAPGPHLGVTGIEGVNLQMDHCSLLPNSLSNNKYVSEKETEAYDIFKRKWLPVRDDSSTFTDSVVAGDFSLEVSFQLHSKYIYYSKKINFK